MLIENAIQSALAIRDAEFPESIMLQWLSSHDGQAWTNVCSQYADAGEKPIYNEDTDTQATELLIPSPWDDIYIDYLVMRIDLENGDIDRYNNGAALYASKRADWANWYNRTHKWKQKTEIML